MGGLRCKWDEALLHHRTGERKDQCSLVRPQIEGAIGVSGYPLHDLEDLRVENHQEFDTQGLFMSEKVADSPIWNPPHNGQGANETSRIGTSSLEISPLFSRTDQLDIRQDLSRNYPLPTQSASALSPPSPSCQPPDPPKMDGLRNKTAFS